VSFFAYALRAKGRAQAFGAVLLTLFATACSGKTVPPVDNATLLQAVPAADVARYSGPQQAKHWENPYLVIRPETVALLTSANPNEEQILKSGEVLGALAHLPASAWPYGRVVAILVDEKAASSETGKIALRRNRGIVEGDLRNAAVEIYLMDAPK
jgi:hypothetical protein